MKSSNGKMFSCCLYRSLIVFSATICSSGRSESDFNNYGTGRMLSFQVGKTPSDLMRVPMDQKDVTAKTKFVEGQCFIAMGRSRIVIVSTCIQAIYRPKISSWSQDNHLTPHKVCATSFPYVLATWKFKSLRSENFLVNKLSSHFLWECNSTGWNLCTSSLGSTAHKLTVGRINCNWCNEFVDTVVGTWKTTITLIVYRQALLVQYQHKHGLWWCFSRVPPL